MKFCEPSIIKKFDDKVFESSILQSITFPKFPLHSQSVEQSVKLVTEAASQVVGEQKRHEHILTKIKARATRKSYNTKRNLHYDVL